MTALNLVLPANQARVNVTYEGANGELPDPVLYDSTDGDVKGWITEALRTGGVPGIPAYPTANIADYVVDRFAATEERPYNFIMIRPKTPFGSKASEAAKTATEQLTKALTNANTDDAKATTSDVQVWGNVDAWELVCKAASQKQGWMKSTKRMKVHGGYIYQVTTEFRSTVDGEVTSCAEALTFVPQANIGTINS